MSVTEALPRWDMSVVFPGLDSPEFRAEMDAVQAQLGETERLFDQLGVEKGAAVAASPFEEAVGAYNALADRVRTLNGYISAFVTTDSRDDRAQAADSEMDAPLVRLRKLARRLTAWIGSADISALLRESEVARVHRFPLEKAVIAAHHQMSPAEEALAAEMEVTGGSAWSKLHANVASQLTAALPGEAEPLPMSVVRARAYDADRERRRAAYEAEIAAWRTVEVPLAAALNGVKGETLTLSKRRGWDEPLDEALFGANVSRETLDAMLTAARESFPDFRRYLRAKARALGVERLAWYDLFAPVGEAGRAWEFDEASRFVADQFRTYSDKLGDFAERTFCERWIDAAPAPGKVDGAYCMGLRRDESRILMNFKPAFGSVSTLAHELGHAYHNLCLNGRTALQRATPMTVAETASIFCETIIRQASLRQASPAEGLAILEASLQGACQVVVDITSRFQFERSVFELRARRELSPSELNARMLDSQLQTYGDGLDPNALHPYMWAAKSHYYGRSFYNFPYMFGLLFGLGLYAVYQREGDGFRERYDELLSSTGLENAATLAARFGIEIRTPEFWRGSLGAIRADVDRFEKLVEARG